MNKNLSNNSTEDLLWKYLDGECSIAEKKIVEEQLLRNASWSEQFENIRRLHAAMKPVNLSSPSHGFTDRVMLRVQEKGAAPKLISPLVIALIVMVFVTCLAYAAVHSPKFFSQGSFPARWQWPEFLDAANSGTVKMLLLMINVLLVLVFGEKLLRGRHGIQKGHHIAG